MTLARSAHSDSEVAVTAPQPVVPEVAVRRASVAPSVPQIVEECEGATRPMASPPPPPTRRHRRLARRRLVREQVIVGFVLFAMLAATVLLLLFEWLANGTVGSNAPSYVHSLGGSS